MIFVTVGTANKGFDRLLEACDQIALSTGISFFAQTGSSGYLPKHMASKPWLDREEMRFYYTQAKAFIIHGGLGTISETIRSGKPVIVVPRKFEDGEAVNNQMDLSGKLDRLNYIKCVEDISTLQAAIETLNTIKLSTYSLTSSVPDILSNYLSSLKLKNQSQPLIS